MGGWGWWGTQLCVYFMILGQYLQDQMNQTGSMLPDEGLAKAIGEYLWEYYSKNKVVTSIRNLIEYSFVNTFLGVWL